MNGCSSDHGVCNTCEKTSIDDLANKLKTLGNPDTCFDYVDGFYERGGKCCVVIFIEPCGKLCKWGDSFTEVLNWWYQVLSTQPAGWDYVKAGWHLDKRFEDFNGVLPDDPADVWKTSPGFVIDIGAAKKRKNKRRAMEYQEILNVTMAWPIRPQPDTGPISVRDRIEELGGKEASGMVTIQKDHRGACRLCVMREVQFDDTSQLIITECISDSMADIYAMLHGEIELHQTTPYFPGIA